MVGRPRRLLLAAGARRAPGLPEPAASFPPSRVCERACRGLSAPLFVCLLACLCLCPEAQPDRSLSLFLSADRDECKEYGSSVCGTWRCENTLGSYRCFMDCQPGRETGDCGEWAFWCLTSPHLSSAVSARLLRVRWNRDTLQKCPS